MRRRNLTAWAWALAVVCAHCGGDGAAPVAPGDTTEIAHRDAGRTGRATAAVPSADPREVALRRLLDAWHAAEDADASNAAAAAIAATGADGAAVLVRWLASDDEELQDVAEALLPRMGEAALGPLVELLARRDGAARRATHMLGRLVPVWRDAPQGPDVARALLARLGVPEEADDARAALREGRPASAVVVPDLVALWTRDEGSDDAVEILESLGTAAAPAAPAAIDVLARGDEDRRDAAVAILRAVGSADPALLAPIAALLTSEDPHVRAGAAEALASWGAEAAPSASALAALLADEDPDVRGAAACALAAMPETALRYAHDVVRGRLGDDAGWSASYDVAFARLLRVPAFAERVLALLPTLGFEQAVSVLEDLRQAGVDRSPAFAGLAARPEADVRGLALDLFGDDDAATAPVPASAAALLDDPDPGVRAHAAALLSKRGAAPEARIRDVALGLRTSADADVRHGAVEALGPLAGRDGAALTALLEALSDPEDSVRFAAALALAADDAPIPGAHTEAVAWIAAHLFDGQGSSTERLARTLLRFEGGERALVEAARAAIRETADGPLQRSPWAVVDVVVLLGPRAAPLLPDVLAWKERHKVDIAGSYVNRALAAISGDPAMAARSGGAATLRRLLTLGPEGRRVVPILFARYGDEEESLEHLLPIAAEASLNAEIAAAARATAPDEHAAAMRLGAAILARVLPATEAVRVLDLLAAGDDDRARTAALDSLVAMETAAPGGVPPASLAPFLRDDRREIRETAAEFAACLGPRAKVLEPELRSLRSSVHAYERVLAAIALWRVTGDAEEALVALRPLLDRPDLATVFTPWPQIGEALAAMKLGAADRDLLLRALPRAPGVHTRAALADAIAALGPAAAPAVPSLRAALSDEFGACDESSQSREVAAAVLRALVSAGPAGRAAIPDVRVWIAETGDPDGVGEAALRALESPR